MLLTFILIRILSVLDEGSQRVEYPSKVKTIRGVDPSTHFENVETLGRYVFRNRFSKVLFIPCIADILSESKANYTSDNLQILIAK